MNFTQLRAFHALASTGGFTKAAQYLGVSQPAITAQLKALEETYGVALFDRNGHRLTLTDTGEYLLQISSHVFRLLAEAEEVLTTASELRAGTIRVGADNPFFIMDLLSAFRSRYPDLKVTVDMGSGFAVLDALRKYETDVAVVTAAHVPEEFVAEPFSRLQLMLLVRPAHPWANREAVSVTEIGDEPLVLRESGSLTRRTLLDSLAVVGAHANVVFELSSQVAVREAVASGLGVGVELDGGLAPDDRIKLVRLADAAVSCQEYVACRRDRYDLRKIKAFFDIAREIGPSLPRVRRLRGTAE
jgi:LysR family transcriptional regulator, low CO2-responsive transcriptional regulator